MRFLSSLFLLAAVATPAFGYHQMVSKNYGVPISQPTNAITMYVNLGCPTQAQCWDKIAQAAIAEWNVVNAPFYIRARVGEAGIPTACAEVDDRNTIQWSATRCRGEAWGDAAGYTWSYINSRGDILESDIRIRRTPPPGQIWTVDFFRHTILHELGHVMGLGHPNEYGQEVRAVMNQGGADLYDGDTTYTRLQLDDRNGIRGLYGALLWDETRYPTELLGAWRLRHPETGQTLRWTFSHLQWIEGGRWAYFHENGVYGYGARGADIWDDWDIPETHVLLFIRPTGTECTEFIGLYEGTNRFSGRLFVGTNKDADGLCQQWPASRQYDVEWWREPVS